MMLVLLTQPCVLVVVPVKLVYCWSSNRGGVSGCHSDHCHSGAVFEEVRECKGGGGEGLDPPP